MRRREDEPAAEHIQSLAVTGVLVDGQIEPLASALSGGGRPAAVVQDMRLAPRKQQDIARRQQPWGSRRLALGALGSVATFIATVTILPFLPDGWDPVVGFPAMTGNLPFLMKDVVLLAVSLYLLKHDVLRLATSPGRVGLAGAGA